MNAKVSILLASLAMLFSFTSCGNDDDEVVIPPFPNPQTITLPVQADTYTGKLHIVVADANGTETDCGSVPSTLVFEVNNSGVATATIKPFAITVAPYGNTTIATGAPLVVTPLAAAPASDGVALTGEFSLMMPTSMRGSEAMPLPLAGTFSGKLKNNQMEYTVEIPSGCWGSMPLTLTLSFSGLANSVN